jgi:hypothetical protein
VDSRVGSHPPVTTIPKRGGGYNPPCPLPVAWVGSILDSARQQGKGWKPNRERSARVNTVGDVALNRTWSIAALAFGFGKNALKSKAYQSALEQP